MQSLDPDFKNNSSSRFQISVTVVMLPWRNRTIERHSFNRFACRSSNQMLCQNFCGSFPIRLFRGGGGVFCFVCFFLPMSASKGWHGCFCVCVSVYTHKDFRVIICVVRPTFLRFVSHYCHLVELKWLHKDKCNPDSSCSVCIFSGNFESGKWKRKLRERWCRTYILWTPGKYTRGTDLYSAQLFLSDFSSGYCV